jgi:hypothetical protein
MEFTLWIAEIVPPWRLYDPLGVPSTKSSPRNLSREIEPVQNPGRLTRESLRPIQLEQSRTWSHDG